MAPTRVLIVDDHPLMRRGLREILAGAADFNVCAEADDIGAALDRFRAVRPQVAILDVSLPSGSGLELARQMFSEDDQLRILFVSMHDDAVFAERALRAGALGYINKSESGSYLLDAARKVARGELALAQPIADHLVRRTVIDVGAPATGVESLSDRELEVLEFIGRGLGTREVAKRLNLSIKTIESHREHIKSKLNLTSGVQLNRWAALWSSGQA